MKRTLVAAAISAPLILGTMLPALAAKPFREHLPPNNDLVIEGVCEFDVLLHDVRNELVVTTFFDRDGNVTKQIGAGALVVELTNLDSGESLVANISGPGVQTFQDDVFTLKAEGNWLFFFFPDELAPGDPGLIWLTSGLWVWEFGPEGGRLVTQRGTSQDVCSLLG